MGHGAPEPVNGLIRVADDEQALAAPAPRLDQLVLDGVAVLELIHQQMGKGVPGANGPLPVRFQRLQQQVVQIHQPLLPEPLLIEGTGFFQAGLDPLGHPVFPAGDLFQQFAGRALFPGLPQHLGRQIPGLVWVDQRRRVPQPLQAQSMESADVHPFGRPRISQGGGQPLAHLFRRFVGECDRRDLLGLGPLLHQAADAGHQGLRFAGARSGHHGDGRRLGFHSPALGRVQFFPGRTDPFCLRGRRFGLGCCPLGLGRGGGRCAKQGHLAAEGVDLRFGQQLDDPIFPIEPRPALDLARPQSADALLHTGARHPADVLQRRLAQDVKFGPQLPQHLLVQPGYFDPAGRQAGGGANGFGQGRQTLKRQGVLFFGPQRPVCQLVYPVVHADGQFFAAHRADASHCLGFLGRQALAAVPMAVEVVLALLGKKLDGAPEPLCRAPFQRPGQGGVGQVDVQQVGLPPQLVGRMGVGVGDQGEPVQGGDPPVHGRVRGEPGLQGMDIGRQVAKAFLDGVKAGKSAEQGRNGASRCGRE